MKTSDKGIELIKSFESLHLKAYLCPAGRWTIGWGHTSGVTPTLRISLTEAERLLREDIAEAETCVSRIPGLNQNQFDALVSFVFNVGARNFAHSTLRRIVVADSNDPNIRYEFHRWRYSTVNGEKVEMEGLVRRRRKEADLYFTKD